MASRKDDERIKNIIDETLEKIASAQERHATELGKIAIAWNSLQLEFGNFFGNLLDGFYLQSLAIWHAVQNDRAQREMLAAAIRGAYDQKDKSLDEIIWAINQANTLENDRNTALHAPYRLGSKGFEVVMDSDWEWGHSRALKLKDKDVSKELTAYAENIIKLKRFVSDVNDVHDTPAPLPKRPRLLRVAQATTHKAKRPQKKKKAPPRQRSTSEE